MCPDGDRPRQYQHYKHECELFLFSPESRPRQGLRHAREAHIKLPRQAANCRTLDQNRLHCPALCATMKRNDNDSH
jgi:hypothetical protein